MTKEWEDRKQRIEPGFEEGSNVLHYTRTMLGMTALCGHYPVDLIGVPEDGVGCDECLRIAEEEGYDIAQSIYMDVMLDSD